MGRSRIFKLRQCPGWTEFDYHRTGNPPDSRRRLRPGGNDIQALDKRGLKKPPPPAFFGACLALAALWLLLLVGFVAPACAVCADQITSRTERPLAAFTANPIVGVPGALQVQTEIQPLATIVYGYDALDRLASRQVSGEGPEAFTYDNLSRLSTDTNDLSVMNDPGGAFTFEYGDTIPITAHPVARPSGARSTDRVTLAGRLC